VNEGQRRDANTTNPDQIEDILELDVDVARDFSVEIVDQLPPDILIRMRSNGIAQASRDLRHNSPPKYGIFKYACHRNEPPVRMYRQHRDFPPGSTQAAFFEHIKGHTTNFVVICEIYPAAGKQKSRESDQMTWQTFQMLTTHIHHLTLDGHPGNDWHLLRDTDYATSGFDSYIQDANKMLPPIPWLLQGEDPKTNAIYPVQNDPTRIFMWRMVFPSFKMYKS
jgi:hypothetical protein